MKVGIVSDIHGNAAALAKAFELMADVDEMICLGDSINQFRFSNETIHLLRERRVKMVLGNHEEIFLGPGSERARAHDWIDRDLMQWMADQPTRLELEFGDKRLLMVHATSWPSGMAYVTPANPAFPRFADCGADFVLYGHTHQKAAARVRSTLVVNPGSTGEAYAGQNDMHYSCAVLDVISDEVRHIDFKLEEA